MGLATRVIPTVLDRHGQMIKGRQFRADRVVGSSHQAARIHNARGVDELIFLDVAATPEGRGPDFDGIAQFASEMFSPLTVGGGVRTVEDVRRLLELGADKVAIRSAGLDLVRACADQFGSQAIVYSLDVPSLVCRETEKYYALKIAKAAERKGAGELLLQSKGRDGTMQGYDLDLIREVSQAVSIPVIASGGCSGYEDMYQAIKAGASAVAAGALFLFTDATPKGAAKYLSQHNIEVRL